MMTKITSFGRPYWAGIKLLPIWLAVCLATTWQNAGAAPYHLVHAFAGGDKDGQRPTFQSSLTVSGSLFYGMTLAGGKYTNGVIFQIKTDGTVGPLVHTFSGWSILNMTGSKTDGAYPTGTPVLSGSTLYGVTQQGGSNGPSYAYGMGTVFSVKTDGTEFKILHNFGAFNDGSTPVGSLVLQGSTLYGMTEAGGSNNLLNGTIYSIQTDGTGYQILHNFDTTTGGPQGSLTLAASSVGVSTLYGMTPGTIFRINTDGSEFLTVHQFTGNTDDGGNAYGSVTLSGTYLYGMTHEGGANLVGTVFKLNLIGSVFQILHSFALTEAAEPYGDLALSGGTLYGMTWFGVTNYDHIGSVGSGAVFQINTNGSGYQVMHTFLFPSVPNDGSLPFGTPIVLGSELYGMTSLGGSTGIPVGAKDGGCIFSLTLSGSSGGGAPEITTTSPLPEGSLGVAYHQQLEASGGATPYTWAVSSGHLPHGLTLSTSGVLSGKPTAGGVSDFSIKVTGHDKSSSTNDFSLTIQATTKTPPTLTITIPKAGEKVTAGTLTVSGTAKGNTALAGVYFQLNGGTWTAASTTDNFAKWYSDNVPLGADENVFSAYAVDTSGNHSKTNTVKFEYFVTGPLIVKTNGSGTFTPNYNGKELQIGATYSITAKPAKGFAFNDWTNGVGTLLTKETTLRFVMESNLTLVANFVASGFSALRGAALPGGKPFLAEAGSYYGLFAPSEGARQNTNSGAIRLALTASGSFSGKLLLGHDAVVFSGNFDPSGEARVLMAQRVTCADCPYAQSSLRGPILVPQKSNTLTVTLQLNAADQAVAGEVTDGAFVAQIGAYRNVFSSGFQAVNYEGKYAVTIPGTGDGTLTVDALGNVTFVGSLADGMSVGQTSAISHDGYWPLYAPVRGGGEPIWAWNELGKSRK